MPSPLLLIDLPCGPVLCLPGVYLGERRGRLMARWPKATLSERFWAKVDKSCGPDACWPWTGSRNPRKGRQMDYGHFWNGSRSMPAHRFSWELANGPVPSGLFVLHRCDNPPCCNPEHLFAGTHRDNMADMNAKGRRSDRRGTESHRAKLTEDDVRAIRAAHARGVGYLAASRMFGVSRSAIRFVIRRKTWRHVA